MKHQPASFHSWLAMLQSSPSLQHFLRILRIRSNKGTALLKLFCPHNHAAHELLTGAGGSSTEGPGLQFDWWTVARKCRSPVNLMHAARLV